jgi:Ni/Fe-hydrogenase subunit HybB-like protein
MERRDDAALFRSIFQTGRRVYILIAILLAIMGWAAFAYITQLRGGLGVTGLNRPVFWGIYLVNFVFFIGISHAGTLVSAILRITGAEWRRPITRAAEAITVFSLVLGVSNILIDLGRIDRVLNLVRHARFQSPLLWDVSSVSVYLTGSVIYLYLPLIPDVAMLRDRLAGTGDWRHWLYDKLSLGWQGTEKQWHRLERAISIMAVLIIPIAVSVHTVVSWIFAMTLQPMWHSTIFGPYFVVGAIFSGIATLIIVMAIIRKAYGLEAFLTRRHFNNLGLLLLTMTLFWFYFTLAEYLTEYYGAEPAPFKVLLAKLTGEFSLAFMAMMFFCFVIPFVISPVRACPTPSASTFPRGLSGLSPWVALPRSCYCMSSLPASSPLSLRGRCWSSRRKAPWRNLLHPPRRKSWHPHEEGDKPIPPSRGTAMRGRVIW